METAHAAVTTRTSSVPAILFFALDTLPLSGAIEHDRG